MNGSALMAPPQVNLDEFEQRLRMVGSPVGPQEDPLEELARLVGLDADEAGSIARAPEPAPRGEALRLPQVHLLQVDAVDGEGSEAGTAAAAPLGVLVDPPLRRALEDVRPAHDFAPQDNRPQPAPALDARRSAAGAEPATSAPRRRRRSALTMGVLVAVGAAGLVGVWVVKGEPGLPRSPALILAADGPTKVKPPSEDGVASTDDASALLRDQSGKSDPITIVSHQEQPNDLQQRSAPQAQQFAAATDAAPPAGATTRSLAAGTVGPTTTAPAAPSPFPTPKPVKVVSVRPDGSIIAPGPDQPVEAGPVPGPAVQLPAPEPAAPQTPPGAANLPANPPAPVARPSQIGAAPQPASPKLDLPTKLSPKSTARVPIPKIDTTVSSPANAAPDAPQQIAAPAADKPARAARPAPAQQIASNDPAPTAAPAGAGGWAVQLAAPPSEKEAQSVSAKLQAKYATEIGGLQPTIRQADSNGKQIYRVRLSGLSKADAAGLCEKLKASGGVCFIARE
ncbi:MAG: SPOR domain-containing protein [Roseiarcus sp.]